MTSRTWVGPVILVWVTLAATGVQAGWGRVGVDIDGEAADDRSGTSVALSADPDTDRYPHPDADKDADANTDVLPDSGTHIDRTPRLHRLGGRGIAGILHRGNRQHWPCPGQQWSPVRGVHRQDRPFLQQADGQEVQRVELGARGAGDDVFYVFFRDEAQGGQATVMRYAAPDIPSMSDVGLALLLGISSLLIVRSSRRTD